MAKLREVTFVEPGRDQPWTIHLRPKEPEAKRAEPELPEKDETERDSR